MAFVLISILSLSLVTATEYYCDSDRFPLVTDLAPEDCDNDNRYYYKENSVNDCFPSCVITNEVIGTTSCIIAGQECPPGYYCNTAISRPKCAINEDSCYKYHVTKPNDYTNAMWKPDCLTDETWAPKQCKGEPANGRCFCVDAVGNRIFGDEFSYLADDMTCACSRRRAEMEAKGDRIFVSLHCDSMGNYEPLQCDVESENCWCVESKTGDMTSAVVPMSLMSKLSCYNETTVGSQYLRQCESHLYAQIKIIDEFQAHGTLRANFPTLRCQYDGSYGPYKISSGIAYCVWRDNTNLGSYLVRTTDDSFSTTTCRCAIDERIHAEAAVGFILSCLANGNYDPLQMDGTQYYCVDDDGFMKSEPQDEEPDCDSII